MQNENWIYSCFFLAQDFKIFIFLCNLYFISLPKVNEKHGKVKKIKRKLILMDTLNINYYNLYKLPLAWVRSEQKITDDGLVRLPTVNLIAVKQRIRCVQSYEVLHALKPVSQVGLFIHNRKQHLWKRNKG